MTEDWVLYLGIPLLMAIAASVHLIWAIVTGRVYDRLWGVWTDVPKSRWWWVIFVIVHLWVIRIALSALWQGWVKLNSG